MYVSIMQKQTAMALQPMKNTNKNKFSQWVELWDEQYIVLSKNDQMFDCSLSYELQSMDWVDGQGL